MGDLVIFVKKLPNHSYFIFREYDLSYSDRLNMALKIIKIAKNKKIKFIVAKDFKLAREVKADGVHFSDNDKLPILFFKKESLPISFIFSYSCHSFKSSINAYKKLKAQLVFISPIFKTSTHPDQKSLGKIQFFKIYNHFPEILPLGGINEQNIAFFKKNKVLGFGAIEFFNKFK